jgi:hypothetical protein
MYDINNACRWTLPIKCCRMSRYLLNLYFSGDKTASVEAVESTKKLCCGIDDYTVNMYFFTGKALCSH